MLDDLKERKLLEESVTNIYLTWLKYEDSRMKSHQSRQNSEKKLKHKEPSSATLEQSKSQHNFVDHGSARTSRTRRSRGERKQQSEREDKSLELSKISGQHSNKETSRVIQTSFHIENAQPLIPAVPSTTEKPKGEVFMQSE